MLQEKHRLMITLSALIWMLLGLPSGIVAEAQPQEVVLGVKVGDWVRYGDFLVTWSSTEIAPNPELMEFNNTSWIRNHVRDVVNTMIIFSQTTQFENETQKTALYQVDIYTGGGNGTLMFIPSGLSAGYLIYPAPRSPVWINETVTRTYAGVTREVNHLNFRETQPAIDDPSNIISVSVSHYWDRETGVLTERFGYGAYIDQTGNQIASWTRSDKIIETNLWSAADQAKGAAGVPFAVVVAVTAVTLTLISAGAWLLWPRKRRVRRRRSRKRR